MRPIETILFAVFSLLPLRPITAAQTTNVEIGFSRIISGWTNYSTAFDTTHDLAPNGEYATVASFYTPTNDVLPIEYGVIVIWNGSGGQRLNFTNFDFQICFWSGLQAFTNYPAWGDIATLSFRAPTGGSTTIANATTRGGRSAYQIRFCLTNAPFVLNQGNTYLVGVSARTFVSHSGELFVPTANYPGPSDLQAGTLVAGSWTYLVDSGGSTIYDGQLAAELIVQPMMLPILAIRRIGDTLELSWPSSANGFELEAAEVIASLSTWSPVGADPVLEGTRFRVSLPFAGPAQWFRLKK
jgi:hypothetical protein